MKKTGFLTTWLQYTSSSDKCLWTWFAKNMLHDLGFSHVWNNHSTFNSGLLLASIKNKLNERFISFWKQRMLGDETKKKLRTFRLFFVYTILELNLTLKMFMTNR